MKTAVTQRKSGVGAREKIVKGKVGMGDEASQPLAGFTEIAVSQPIESGPGSSGQGSGQVQESRRGRTVIKITTESRCFDRSNKYFFDSWRARATIIYEKSNLGADDNHEHTAVIWVGRLFSWYAGGALPEAALPLSHTGPMERRISPTRHCPRP